MTAIEEARAALAKWDRSSFPDAGYAYLAESLRTLIAEYERLSVPPSDDEREALARVIRENRSIAKIMGDGYVSVMQAGDDEIADAILASDVWRNRRQGPITDAQRHADDLLWYVDYCLGLPMYQNAISEFGQGAVEALRMVKRTLADGLHPDAQAAAERARSAVPSTAEQEGER